VDGVEPLKPLTEPTWISAGTFGPQSTAGCEEGTNFAFDERIGVPGDPKATFIASWDPHCPILASKLGAAARVAGSYEEATVASGRGRANA
jgi:hypothetical protein